MMGVSRGVPVLREEMDSGVGESSEHLNIAYIPVVLNAKKEAYVTSDLHRSISNNTSPPPK